MPTPTAYLTPASLADLSVDVALTAPARGDLLYRGASKWNNLVAGTSGKFLQTNGAGADPSWATVDLTTLVTLAPASVDRNLIVPTADANKGLAVQAHSATQSAGLIEAERSDTSVWGILGDSAALGTYSVAHGLTLTPAAGEGGLLISRSATPTVGYEIEVLDKNGFPLFTIADPGIDAVAGLSCPVDQLVLGVGTSAVDQASSVFQVSAITNNAGLGGANMIEFQSSGAIRWRIPDDTGSNFPKVAQLVPEWASNGSGATRGRLRLEAIDAGGTRECLRIESEGTNPLTHVLGSFSAPRVSTSSNTTLGGGHFSIFEDTTGGNKTVTLPTAVGIDGRIYCIKNTGTGANTLTVATTSAQTIDGAAGASTTTPQACLILQSDGANWQTLSIN